jgi:hypothetical protein
MTKLTQFFTAAGTVNLSQGGQKMVQAFRAGATPQEAAEQSGLTLRQVQRLSALSPVRWLVANTAPLTPVRVSRRVSRAIDYLMHKGATEKEAAAAAGIELHHLREQLSRDDVAMLCKAMIIDKFRAALPRAREIQAEFRAKRRAKGCRKGRAREQSSACMCAQCAAASRKPAEAGTENVVCLQARTCSRSTERTGNPSEIASFRGMDQG